VRKIVVLGTSHLTSWVYSLNLLRMETFARSFAVCRTWRRHLGEALAHSGRIPREKDQ